MQNRIVRDDLSNSLIHLTKGTRNEAFTSFYNILCERKIRGGNGFIKSRDLCVCLSDAPIAKVALFMSASQHKFKYQPFGFMFKKKWIAQKGGLPVIYQPDRDFELLPLEKRHLHVRFDICARSPVDFTWEREWRIKTSELAFDPGDVTLILPDRKVADSMKEEFLRVNREENARDSSIEFEVYPYHCVVLEDLGIELPHGLM